MADQATIRAPVAIAACFLFLILGALIGFLFAGPGDLGGPAGSAARPEGGGDFGGFIFENPLRPAEVGEWALYDRGTGKQLRMEVMRVDAGTGAINMLQEDWDPELDTRLGYRNVPVQPNHFLWSHDQAAFVVTKVFPERIVAAGRTFDCLCVEMISGRQGMIRSWYSAEVPVTGLVRQKTVSGPHAGFLNAEITDWSGR